MAWSKPEWNAPMGAKPEQTPTPRKHLNLRLAGVLAGVIVVLGAFTAWFVLDPGPQPAPAPEPKKTVKPKKSASRPVVKPKPMPKPEMPKKAVAHPAAPGVRGADITTEARETAYVKQLVETPLPNTFSNRLFRSGLEQVMGWVFTTEVGDMPPPLPMIPDHDLAHLEEILNSKSAITENDTERQADAKETVDFAKQELKKFLEKGGTPDEFLAYYHDQLKVAYERRRLVESQAIQVMQEDPELVDAFLEKANKNLVKDGIKAAVVPERIRRRILATRNAQ